MTKSHGLSQPRRQPMSLHNFYAKNIPSRKIPYLVELDETPRFWYPSVTHDAWIDFSSLTVELQPSKCQENLPFFFLSPPFLSLASFSHFSPIFFLSFLPFVCSQFHFLFFSFSLFSHFLISLFFSSLSFPSFSLFFFSFELHQSNGPKSGKLPPHFLVCHLSFSHFS